MGGLLAATDTNREEDMEVESLGTVGTSALTPKQRRNHLVQDVFSAVLAEAGRQGYASAEAVTDEQPLEEQITTSWFDWFDGKRQEGLYARVTEGEALKQSYGEILLRAYEEGGYAAPKAFLNSLTKDELEVVQRVHALTDTIQVDSLSEEGAVNLLVPPPAQIDLNHNGVTLSGTARTIRFPSSTTPPEVVTAWEEATAGMSWAERSVYVMHMMLPIMTANTVRDSNGNFLYDREPGDPGFFNPMASPDYSYIQATQDYLDQLEAFHDKMPIEKYGRDKAFWTLFQERLTENGAK